MIRGSFFTKPKAIHELTRSTRNTKSHEKKQDTDHDQLQVIEKLPSSPGSNAITRTTESGSNGPYM